MINVCIDVYTFVNNTFVNVRGSFADHMEKCFVFLCLKERVRSLKYLVLMTKPPPMVNIVSLPEMQILEGELGFNDTSGLYSRTQHILFSRDIARLH